MHVHESWRQLLTSQDHRAQAGAADRRELGTQHAIQRRNGQQMRDLPRRGSSRNICPTSSSASSSSTNSVPPPHSVPQMPANELSNVSRDSSRNRS